jgi:hypothetical protein
MCAMRGAERVVHVDVRKRGELLGQSARRFFFFRMEPEVFQQHDAVVKRRTTPRDAAGPIAILGKGDALAEQVACSPRDRLQDSSRD